MVKNFVISSQDTKTTKILCFEISVLYHYTVVLPFINLCTKFDQCILVTKNKFFIGDRDAARLGFLEDQHCADTT